MGQKWFVAKVSTVRAAAEAGLAMDASVTVPMAAPADKIWNLVADVRNTGRFSPEVMEAEWLDGATGPALGARFRGHVKRNEIGPVYWTTCRVTACEPGREFGFEVLVGDTPVNNWHYLFTPVDGGTEVTESFRLNDSVLTRVVLGVRRPAAPTAQRPRYAENPGADQGAILSWRATIFSASLALAFCPPTSVLRKTKYALRAWARSRMASLRP